MKKSKGIFLLILMVLSVNFVRAQVIINEFMASNQNTIIDNTTDKSSDWLELYNTGSSTVLLTGWYLTDDPLLPTKWTFGAGLAIGAGSYLMIWADGLGTNNHTNFKLSASGEFIGLYNSTGLLQDSLSFGEQLMDVSYGRQPNAGETWSLMNNATPGVLNTSAAYQPQIPPSVLLPIGGFYATTQQVSISNPAEGVSIYYTLDYSEPTQASSLYTAPITAASNTVIRTRAYKSGEIASEMTSQTYLIDEPIPTLPVVCVVTDEDNLYDNQTGIYTIGTNGIVGRCVYDYPVNWNQDWERPANVELYDASQVQQLNFNAGIKIMGGCSRKYDFKSLAYYDRTPRENAIDYQLFTDRKETRYKSFNTRCGGNDYINSKGTQFREGFMQSVIAGQMDVDYQSFQPALQYMNGEYWGISSLRERLNDEYIKRHHGYRSDEIDFIGINGDYEVRDGDDVEYLALIDYLQRNSLSNTDKYAYIKTKIDIPEYINYMLYELYICNTDWPANNQKFWRPRTVNGKWRWILYDLDYGFGDRYPNGDINRYDYNSMDMITDDNGPGWPNPAWATMMFRRMLESPEFEEDFLQEFNYHLNTTFKPERVLHIYDSIRTIFEPEIDRYLARMQDHPNSGWINDYQKWDSLCNLFRAYGELRPDIQRQQLINHFNLSGQSTLTVQDSPNGTVSLNAHELPANYAELHFNGIPVTLTAQPLPCYEFVSWQVGSTMYTEEEITITISSDVSAVASYQDVSASAAVQGLLINELCPNNDGINVDEFGEYNDWIELYNTGSTAVDIGGFYLTDDPLNRYKYRIPNTDANVTTVAAGGRLIVWIDNDDEQGILHASFGLSKNGGYIAISDACNLLDGVSYSDISRDFSFIRYTDGTDSWMLTQTPTPGLANVLEQALAVHEPLPEVRIYPNPTEGVFTVEGIINTAVVVKDIQGQTVIHSLSSIVDISDNPAGIYLIIINDKVFKVIKY